MEPDLTFFQATDLCAKHRYVVASCREGLTSQTKRMYLEHGRGYIQVKWYGTNPLLSETGWVKLEDSDFEKINKMVESCDFTKEGVLMVDNGIGSYFNIFSYSQDS